MMKKKFPALGSGRQRCGFRRWWLVGFILGDFFLNREGTVVVHAHQEPQDDHRVVKEEEAAIAPALTTVSPEASSSWSDVGPGAADGRTGGMTTTTITTTTTIHSAENTDPIPTTTPENPLPNPPPLPHLLSPIHHNMDEPLPAAHSPRSSLPPFQASSPLIPPSTLPPVHSHQYTDPLHHDHPHDPHQKNHDPSGHHFPWTTATTTLAGSSRSVGHRLISWLHPEKAPALWQALRHVIHIEDVFLLALAGWLPVVVMEYLYYQPPPYHEPPPPHRQDTAASENHDRDQDENNNKPGGWKEKLASLGTFLLRFKPVSWSSSPTSSYTYVSFRQTSLFYWTDLAQQAVRIALLIYMVDILKIICVEIGFDMCKMDQFPHAFGQIAYLLWGARQVQSLARYYQRQYVNQHPETWGRMMIVQKLVDAALVAVVVLIILGILKLEMGLAMSSLIAWSSVGTLAMGLASQGIAKEILTGLLLASSDRLYEGDVVKFRKGPALSGTIIKMGWLETVLRGSDEVTVSIPNTELLNQQVSNLSRVRYSQVEQILRFHTLDADRIPWVLDRIRDEICAACPELVTDGSRPFRAHWTEYGPDHLEVRVEAHFRIRPVGDAYWDNRQACLQAIHRAVRSCGLKFAHEPRDDPPLSPNSPFPGPPQLVPRTANTAGEVVTSTRGLPPRLFLDDVFTLRMSLAQAFVMLTNYPRWIGEPNLIQSVTSLPCC